MAGFRDLRVWHDAMELASAVYRFTARLPAEERFGLTSQMRRAAVSVPVNLAEGNARRGKGEYVHFVSIARGSLAELETYLELLPRLGYAAPDDTLGLLDQAAAVGRQLTNLRNHLTTQAGD